MRLLPKHRHKNSLSNFIAILLILGITAITLLSIGSSFGGSLYFEIASHFKVQYLFITILLFFLLSLTRKKLFFIIALFCVFINTADVIHWYIPQAIPSQQSLNKIRVLLVNINTQNNNYFQVISLVRKEKPDVAVFLELDEFWANQLQSINDILPYAVGRANPDNMGIAVYSKRPLEKPDIKFLGSSNNASVVGDLLINKQVISLVATHFLPPLQPELLLSTKQQLNAVSSYVKQLKQPKLIIGDLNTTMWSHSYKDFIQKTGLRNARQGFGILPTWPTEAKFSPIKPPLSWLLLIPIDHFLISPEIKVLNIRTGANVGSDHLPLIAELVLDK
ncbi:MAG TPA: endonuclease/exonuclease/phosphatase family protein [Oculatellaceae cyanobacterium]|jgi:endonuclease/exonuclease/phosphatase (EEP) superfamily protein YafD